MADSFLFNVAESVLGKLGCLALQEFSLAWGLESDLEKIKDNLKVIKAVLLDAEQQRSQNPQIEVWLENLKEVLYDAEDVVDEFECEVLRRQVVKSGNTTRKMLLMSLGGNKLDDIIETLLQCVDGENVSIIPIVGIGGIGKTTLAKLVYNDQRIATHFELKLWVCVSDVFELDGIIKVLDSASTGQRYADMGIDQLQTLREALNGNKYLLILDDVWSEDPRKWGELKTLLMGGADGSKISYHS
ncbi:hypothetical protein GH714_032777 [Hevea brasiliensis]|uniref:Rx N-terminal domain-containing protein n=1 Tax=Hevea brasiliensis TaxID=3981 RepID=A0A6A6M7G9_HEVBR|nr:hypothetical protein GH714_032777 [Hevea brasiliensis]